MPIELTRVLVKAHPSCKLYVRYRYQQTDYMYLGRVRNGGNLVSICSDAYDMSRSDPLQVYANLTAIPNLKDLTLTNLYSGPHGALDLGPMGPLKLRSLEITGKLTESRCRLLAFRLVTV